MLLRSNESEEILKILREAGEEHLDIGCILEIANNQYYQSNAVLQEIIKRTCPEEFYLVGTKTILKFADKYDHHSREVILLQLLKAIPVIKENTGPYREWILHKCLSHREFSEKVKAKIVEKMDIIKLLHLSSEWASWTLSSDIVEVYVRRLIGVERVSISELISVAIKKNVMNFLCWN